MGRRNKLDIVAEILELAISGINRTSLVYQSNINFTILRTYLKILTEKGFIEVYDKKLFSTVIGIEFLEKYWQLMEFWNTVDNELGIFYSNKKISLRDSKNTNKIAYINK